MIAGLPARAPTTTGISYFRPLASVTFSNNHALRSSSDKPRYCQRTSGCSSVSLLMTLVMRRNSRVLRGFLNVDANPNKAYVNLSYVSKTIPQKYRIETKASTGPGCFSAIMH